MEPLDLTKKPPRSPWEQLAGLYMMARTVDKLRAGLPGGNLGGYRIAGFSASVLKHIGVEEDDLRAVVALASGDDEVAQWLGKHTDASRYAEINERLSNRKIADLTDIEDYYKRYPVAKGLPTETRLFDALLLDDNTPVD